MTPRWLDNRTVLGKRHELLNNAGSMQEATLIRPLHGLRGLAAMSVVVGHEASRSFSASIGVMLFFLLSGYLIGRLYLERDFSAANLWQYGVARLARVYPLFALAIIAAAVTNLVLDASVFHLTPDLILPHLLLAGSANTVWTVSVEFQFYAAFVALWAMRAQGMLPGWLLVLLLLASGYFGFTLTADAGKIALLRFFYLFIAGLAIAHFAPRASPRFTGACGVALPLFMVAYLAVAITYPDDMIYNNPLVALVCTGVVTAAVCAPTSAAGRWLGTAPLFWLGEISFGIYLLHRFAERMRNPLWDLHLHPAILFTLTVALTLVAAHFAHILIERPMRDLVRNAGARLAVRLGDRPRTAG